MPSFPFPPGYLGSNRYQFGVLITLLPIGAFFAALMLAFLLAVPNQTVAIHIHLPPVLWFSTALIAGSSAVFESAKYSLRRARIEAYRKRLLGAMALATVFIACQVYSWERLASQGVDMAGNPRGSAFYIFTGVHAAHLLIGIVGAWVVFRRSSALDVASEQSLRTQRRVNGAVGLYWHSMGLLWLVLFGLLLAWSN